MVPLYTYKGDSRDNKRFPDEPGIPRKALVLIGAALLPFAGQLLDSVVETGDHWGSIAGGVIAVGTLLVVGTMKALEWKRGRSADLFDVNVTGPTTDGFFHLSTNLKHVAEDDVEVYVNGLTGVVDIHKNPLQPTWNLPWGKDPTHINEYRRLRRNAPDQVNLARVRTKESRTLQAYSTSGGALVLTFDGEEDQAVFSLVIHGRNIGAIYMNATLGYDDAGKGMVFSQTITSRQSPSDLRAHGLRDEIKQ